MTTHESQTPGRKQRADGARTHAAILDAATRLASVEGIQGLSLGRLAAELGVSKSGLYAHFGSKEQLQLETIDAALEIFGREVIAPAEQVSAGRRRIEAMLNAYFSYLERWVFPGGCFFAALLAEIDATEGALHQKLTTLERGWLEMFVSYIEEAKELGEIRPDVDAAQLVFELYACMELANYHFVLFRDDAVLERGRRAVTKLLNQSLSE